MPLALRAVHHTRSSPAHLAPAQHSHCLHTQAIVLASPAAQHYAGSQAALLAGKDVFVEKPLALRCPEAEELVALARERRARADGRPPPRVPPGHPQLKELVDAGRAGRHPLHLLEPPQPGEGAARGEHPLELRAPRHLGDPPPAGAAARERHHRRPALPPARTSPTSTMTCLNFPERRARAHLRELAAPLQGAAAGGGGQPAHGRLRRREPTGKLKLYDQGIEWNDGVPVPAQRRRGDALLPDTEPLREELRALPRRACARAARPAPTARPRCACCACWTPASARWTRAGGPSRSARSWRPHGFEGLLRARDSSYVDEPAPRSGPARRSGTSRT